MSEGSKDAVRVWDPFVRLFHWALVFIVVSNRFVNESGGDWHERLGVTACILIGLRIVWGFIGSRYARFSEIANRWPARGSRSAHLREYLSERMPRFLGHSPLAALGMAGMLICILLLGLTGWMMGWDRYFGEDWVEEVHELFANALLVLVAVHVVGVIRASRLHGENLIAAMIHGKKRSE